MKLFDVGAHAVGVIAVGQQATGFFAFGQFATGVIAIGQVARGGIAIGQLAFGLIGWGQVGAGMFHAVGMVGVGGRGFGPVLRLVPLLGRPRVLPPTTTLDAVEAGSAGWIEADLEKDLRLYNKGGAVLPIKLDRRLQQGGQEVTALGRHRVLAHTRRVALGASREYLLVCDRIAYEPARPYERRGFWVLAAFQALGLVALGTAFVALVAPDLELVIHQTFGKEPPAVVRPPAPTRPAKPAPRGHPR